MTDEKSPFPPIVQGNGVQVIQMLITFIPGSPPQVQVQGPVQDKLLCYGMLELARDAIKDFKPPAIVTAPPDLLSHLKGNGGGPVQ